MKYERQLRLDEFVDYLRTQAATRGVYILESDGYRAGRFAFTIDINCKIEGIEELPPSDPPVWQNAPTKTRKYTDVSFEALPDDADFGEESDRDIALGALRKALDALDAAESNVETAVTTARASGATWNDIGNIAGVTYQAAHQRWAKGASAKNARRQRAWVERQRAGGQPPR